MRTGLAALINQEVEAGMKGFAQSDGRYGINLAGHSLPNNEANARKLRTIYWHPTLTREERVDKIVTEFMQPSGIDRLIVGQFTEHLDGTIDLRPVVIARASKTIRTKSRIYAGEEFLCPNRPPPSTLCQKSAKDIRETVIRLLSGF